MKNLEPSHLKHITEVATQLSVTEIGLGALLHGFHIPFAGHALSMNQGLILASLSERSLGRAEAAKSAIEVSSVAAVLKSLAPLGNTFGPMLSLTMQGLLYAFGVLVLGKNILGQILGLVFLCTWAFVQPIITYGLVFGPRLLKDGQVLFESLCRRFGFSENSWIYFFLFLFLVKITLTIALRLGLISFRYRNLNQLGSQTLLKKSQASQPNSVLVSVFREMTKPLFLFSMGLTFVFALFAKANPTTLAFIFLRPLAVGFILFLLLRTPVTFRGLERMLGRTSFGKRVLAVTRDSLALLDGN